MASKIKIKRSAVAGKVPLTTDLELSELAVNTNDGRLYTKKDNGTESIVEIGGPDFGSRNVTTTGTSTAASFTPTSSTVPTNGVYLPAANSVALSTNGTEQLRINDFGAFGVTGANYGTSGQVLISSGSNAAPSWGPVPPQTQLTVDLDVQTYALYTTTTNGDIDLNANGAGLVKVIEYNLSQVPIVTQHDIGTAPNEIPLNGMLGTMAYQDASSPSVDDLVISAGILVSALPAGPVGMIARVTDANSPAVGSAVAGGGATNALVWYNGSNWTVLGI